MGILGRLHSNFCCLPSGPPSAPVNLISSVNGTSVTLEWAPPLDPGGRSDITYNAVCRRCPWALSHCEACGSGTRFVPQQTSLAQASLLVANLNTAQLIGEDGAIVYEQVLNMTSPQLSVGTRQASVSPPTAPTERSEERRGGKEC